MTTATADSDKYSTSTLVRRLLMDVGLTHSRLYAIRIALILGGAAALAALRHRLRTDAGRRGGDGGYRLSAWHHDQRNRGDAQFPRHRVRQPGRNGHLYGERICRLWRRRDVVADRQSHHR